MTFFSQIGWFFRQFFTRGGMSLSCTSSCARQHARWARFGVCIVGFGRQLYTLKIIMTGQQLVYEAFPFGKSTSITLAIII